MRMTSRLKTKKNRLQDKKLQMCEEYTIDNMLSYMITYCIR